MGGGGRGVGGGGWGVGGGGGGGGGGGEGAERGEVLAACEALVGEVIKAEGVVVLHAPKGELDAAEFADSLSTSERTYGSTSIWYLG